MLFVYCFLQCEMLMLVKVVFKINCGYPAFFVINGLNIAEINDGGIKQIVNYGCASQGVDINLTIIVLFSGCEVTVNCKENLS